MNLKKLRNADFVFNDQKKICNHDIQVTSDSSTCRFFLPTAPLLGWMENFLNLIDKEGTFQELTNYIFWCCNFFMIQPRYRQESRVFTFYMYFLLCYRRWKTPQPIPPIHPPSFGGASTVIVRTEATCRLPTHGMSIPTGVLWPRQVVKKKTFKWYESVTIRNIMTANFGPVMKGCLVLRVLWQQKKFKVKSHTTHQFGPENFPLKTSKATVKPWKNPTKTKPSMPCSPPGNHPGEWFGSELPGFFLRDLMSWFFSE